MRTRAGCGRPAPLARARLRRRARQSSRRRRARRRATAACSPAATTGNQTLASPLVRWTRDNQVDLLKSASPQTVGVAARPEAGFPTAGAHLHLGMVEAGRGGAARALEIDQVLLRQRRLRHRRRERLGRRPRRPASSATPAGGRCRAAAAAAAARRLDVPHKHPNRVEDLGAMSAFTTSTKPRFTTSRWSHSSSIDSARESVRSLSRSRRDRGAERGAHRPEPRWCAEASRSRADGRGIDASPESSTGDALAAAASPSARSATAGDGGGDDGAHAGENARRCRRRRGAAKRRRPETWPPSPVLWAAASAPGGDAGGGAGASPIAPIPGEPDLSDLAGVDAASAHLRRLLVEGRHMCSPPCSRCGWWALIGDAPELPTPRMPRPPGEMPALALLSVLRGDSSECESANRTPCARRPRSCAASNFASPLGRPQAAGARRLRARLVSPRHRQLAHVGEAANMMPRRVVPSADEELRHSRHPRRHRRPPPPLLTRLLGAAARTADDLPPGRES